MDKFAQLLCSASIAGLVMPPLALAGVQWMLMARHGECAEIESLKRVVPDLGDVRDPYSFADLMRRRGLQVSSTEVSGSNGKAVEVKVAEKELSLVFVAPELCEKVTERRRR